MAKSATSEPRMAVTANFGAGKNASRFSTLPSNFENVRLVTGLGAAALTGPEMSTVSKSPEDQADRVGLRYAYEAGFPVDGAPGVWQRFLEKYGQEDRMTNFFFSDHSLASARKGNLEREIANNYGPR